MAELRQFQCQFDQSLMAYQQALDIYLQQPYEYTVYLMISSIINEMTEIFVEEKQADHRSAIQ